MSWIDNTLKEFMNRLEEYEEFGESGSPSKKDIRDFVRAKLLESYKNGAEAERRKHFTPKAERSNIKAYGKETKGDQQRRARSHYEKRVR